MMEKYNIIIAAGGSSRRYGETDKLLEELDGLPVLCHSIRNFAPFALPGGLIVAARAEALENYRTLTRRLLPETGVLWVPGGVSRTASVRNALAALPPERTGLVAIHDAARPLASARLLCRVAGRARVCGGAIAASRVVDSMKMTGSGNEILRPLPRESLWRAETPQIFDLTRLREAYAKLGDAEPTDDAEVMRLAGFPVEVVESEEFNGKLTTAGDLALLQYFSGRSK